MIYFSSRFGLLVDKIRYFPPLGWGITQKGVGEYFEDYATFVYKADVGGFQEKKSVYITTWVKTAFVTQCCIRKCNICMFCHLFRVYSFAVVTYFDIPLLVCVWVLKIYLFGCGDSTPS